jgi:ABC-type nitrate/sulfonate/bicarbonate transport system substrate-binding protein
MRSKLTRRRFLHGSARAALLTTAFGAWITPAAMSPSVRIANATGSLNLVMNELMRQQRFLEALGLAPELMGIADGTRILGGLIGGSVDVSMMSGFAQAFPAIERGAPLRILGGGAILPGLALFSGKPQITALKDLEGRIIGTGSIGALVYQLTAALLLKYKVDIAKIRFVNVGSSADIFRAVSAGTVDAGAADVALIDHATEHHVHLVEHGNMSVELKDYTYQGAWTTAAKIASMRETLVRTLAAYARLYRFVESPSARDAFFKARRTVFPSGSEGDSLAQWNYIQNSKPFALQLTLSSDQLRYMQDLNIRFGVQKGILPFEQVADMTLAQGALKLVGA